MKNKTEMEKRLDIALRKFSAAMRKGKKVAKGKYVALELHCNIHSGEEEIECYVYREDASGHYGDTWERAFRKLEDQIEEKELD